MSKKTKISKCDMRLLEARKIMDEFVVTLDGVSVTVQFSQAIEIMLKCKGKIVTTGMGKAGHAMGKFSSLLCSLGFPSVFLHPGEATHGDLGLITPNDVLFVASTSGKTREIVDLIELARNINVGWVIGITSHPDSKLRDMVDVVLDMGMIKEAGHLSVAPTSSILVMLAITDCLALVAAKEKGFTLDSYGRYHHSGYLGSVARRDSNIY